MLGLFLQVAREVKNSRQFGIYACVCFGLAAIGTEVEQLGNVVTYRLPLNVAGVVFGCIFLVKTHYANKR